MVSSINRSIEKIPLTAPILFLVLAAIAIPVELRPLGRASLGFAPGVSDVVENVVGFVPIGIVLGPLGFLGATLAATAISTFAEAGQFVMMHREPSAVDVASNLIGAMLGTYLATRWKVRLPELRVNQGVALLGAALAFVVVLLVWASPGARVNDRGVTLPGTLEAHWKFDESQGRDALDSTEHGLNGRFHSNPKRVVGVLDGGAIQLDGKSDHIDFGHSSALRLRASMTISAWINSTSFPVDDAAIVSQLNRRVGYQLDTTVDRGPRTIGFKLTNACGDLMARYGATPLVVGRWYHVTGVYDAGTRTLDVYLNGVLDNGFLLGTVTSMQHSSRSAVLVGRRSDFNGFEFAGAIDDVRIYSFALTNTEIAAVMRGEMIARPTSHSQIETGTRSSRSELYVPCAVSSDREDKRIPLAAAGFGVLVAIAFLGFFPSAPLPLGLAISFAAGLLLVPATASTLPWLTRWMMPVISLAGGATVVVSARRQNPHDS